MRRLPLFPLALSLVAFGAACGGGKSADIDAPSGDGDGAVTDGPAGPDGPSPDAPMANCVPRSGTNVALSAPITSDLDTPLLVTFAPGDTRLFVVEQAGRIRVIKDGTLLPTPFLDLSGANGRVLSGGERGLLALAFHPQFGSNGKFYVHYSGRAAGAGTASGDHVLAEFTAAAGSDTADPASFRQLMRFTDPYSNHNGGALEFGRDGKLYMSIGDGGSGGDPGDRAQNDNELFGKILRIDVDARTGNLAYGIPADNPFVNDAGKRGEIWHKGLRNPFRFTFDRMTGDIYIGDVGQGGSGYPQPLNQPLEEIDVGPNTAGINWGWRIREGNRCFNPQSGCSTTGLREPVTTHSGSQGWASIMGGAVYRGTCFPDLVGTYFYGDHSAGDLWAFRYENGQAMNDREVIPNIGPITSIHEDVTGELYVTLINGSLRRIIVP